MRKPLFFTMFLLCGISFGSEYTILRRGQERANISISCNYKPERKSTIKTFSKGFNKTILIQTKHGQGANIISNGRYSIHDDSKNRIFTVTMYNLTLEDAGMYWCELETKLKGENTKVSLDVDKAPPVISKPKLSTSLPSTSSSITTATSDATTDTLICTRTTSPQGSKFKEILLYSVVALGVMLLLSVALGLLLHFRQRHRRDKTVNESKQGVPCSRSTEENVIYEKIQFTSHQTDHQSDGVNLSNLLSGTDQTETNTIDSPYSLLICHTGPDPHDLSRIVNYSTETGTVTNTI